MKYNVTVSPNIFTLSALSQLVQSPGQKERVLILTWFYTFLGVILPKKKNPTKQPTESQSPKDPSFLMQTLARIGPGEGSDLLRATAEPYRTLGPPTPTL